MNEFTNRHMNVFHHYTHDGTMPIENNLTRGLAILLEEYPKLLVSFLGKVGAGKPDGKYIAGIQQKTEKLPDLFPDREINRIIGVALTAGTAGQMEAENTDQPIQNETGRAAQDTSDRKYIPDIYIAYDNTLVIVEAKRDASDPTAQLMAQIDSIAGVTNKSFKRITWGDILQIISDAPDKNERLVRDYYQELVLSHPEWQPVSRLCCINDSADEFNINRRLRELRIETANELHKKAEEKNGRQFINVKSWEFASECEVSYSKDTEQIIARIHIADTKKQFDAVSGHWKDAVWIIEPKSIKAFEDYLSKKYKSVISVVVEPYITMRHIKQYRDHRIIGRFTSDSPTILSGKEYDDAVTILRGQWKKGEWDDLQNKIDSIDDAVIGKEDKKYISHLKNWKGDNFLYVYAGYALSVCIPFDAVKKWDTETDSSAAEKMADIINRIHDFVVSGDVENKQ